MIPDLWGGVESVLSLWLVQTLRLNHRATADRSGGVGPNSRGLPPAQAKDHAAPAVARTFPLSLAVQPITARATGLRLWRIFRRRKIAYRKSEICNLPLCAVMS